RPRVFSDLTQEEKDRYKADIRATNILLQGLSKYIYTLINHYTDAKDIQDNVKMILEGFELIKDDRESELYDDFKHFKQNKDVDEALVLDMVQNEDNIFQADQYDAFDSDVDDALTAQIMFMANLSSARPVFDEAGPSYDF
nr:integrase, catalytic region, zinc finger, CCHC-type, peptidase aspartic, catalytic [Tanacetum cinerariifolium]